MSLAALIAIYLVVAAAQAYCVWLIADHVLTRISSALRDMQQRRSDRW